MTPNPQIPKGYFFSFLIAPLFCNPISSPSPDYAQSHFFRPLVESGMNTVHYRNLNFKSAIFLAKFQVLFFYDRPRQYISISIFFHIATNFHIVQATINMLLPIRDTDTVISLLYYRFSLKNGHANVTYRACEQDEENQKHILDIDDSIKVTQTELFREDTDTLRIISEKITTIIDKLETIQ